MVERKNWIKLIALTAITLIASYLLISLKYINIEIIIAEGKGFHYNAISMSAVIGGFLFTGLSILISSIDKPRIARLWEGDYLNNLYRAAFIGMGSNLITIIFAFAMIICSVDEKLYGLFISIEVTSIISGIVYFAWCIKQLIFIIKRIRN